VLGKDVILIAQQGNVPFDFLAQRLILYEDSLPGSLSLREELMDRLQRYKVMREPSTAANQRMEPTRGGTQSRAAHS
jgi:hypothetical protein